MPLHPLFDWPGLNWQELHCTCGTSLQGARDTQAPCLTACSASQREGLQQELEEKVGPDVAHLVLQLLQLKPGQRLSASQALELPCCATVLQQQQQQPQGSAGAESSNSASGSMRMDRIEPEGHRAGGACSSAEPAESSADATSTSSCGAVQQGRQGQDDTAGPQALCEEQGAGRRPWWGAPLCR